MIIYKDSVHMKLKRLIKIGQSPNKHKTNGENTLLKKLHTLFTRGDLYIDRDGTVMVTAKQKKKQSKRNIRVKTKKHLQSRTFKLVTLYLSAMQPPRSRLESYMLLPTLLR